MRTPRLLKRGLGLATAVLLSIVGCSSQEESATERRPAPEFRLEDLEGMPVSLRDFRGRTVVLDFWATWCPPCVFQIPILNEVYDSYREQGVVVIGISVDTEGREVVAAFAQENEVRYPILLGDEGLARKYGAPGFPSLVVVWPDGTLEKKPPHVGLVEKEALKAELERIRTSGGS